MKVVAVVQARMGSVRFPGKVMRPLAGKPMIGVLLTRLGLSKLIDEVILATSENPENDPLENYVQSLGIRVFRGSETDVLDRFFKAAQLAQADVVIRITGDCPLVDPFLVDQLVQQYRDTDIDYLSNVAPPTFPDGLDIEVFSFRVLSEIAERATEEGDREHVTTLIRRADDFRCENWSSDVDYSGLRWTVDTPEDYSVVKKIYSYFSPRIDFSWTDVLALYREQPELFLDNAADSRNEGKDMNTGQKLWRRAKAVIPGGNMLLSKRAEMFLPEKWPAYFSRSSGCRLWDLDGKEYLDVSLMGVGTNVLGYACQEVDDAVRETVSKGNLSTFNCPEEVYLAERLVEMHPWADMVRFARSGGEANAIAIRIARAHSKRDKVAICGYHGWHDWYLAANLSQGGNLDEHLLSGLEPNGVPANLAGSVIPFRYNDLEELATIVKRGGVGAIKMEVSRSEGPAEGFLEGVRKLADDNNIILIFDECTSGFRQTFGGLHKIYGVEPDMAIFGKTLGNGYAITCVLGEREIMQSAQSSFISSTFWTERIGPTAALKTLEIMEREKSWETITRLGSDISRRWQALGDSCDLTIQVSGLPALTNFSINSPDMLKYKTFITQEMLKQGILATNAVYVSLAHEEAIIDQYFEALEPLFGVIADCHNGDRKIDDLLEGPVCHAGFQRLN